MCAVLAVNQSGFVFVVDIGVVMLGGCIYIIFFFSLREEDERGERDERIVILIYVFPFSDARLALSVGAGII